MKATIRLLVRFILWFTLVVLVSSALVVAHAYVTGFDPAGASIATPFLEHLVGALTLVWVPSVLLAAIIALFSAARSMQASVAAIGVLFVVWTGLLLAGGILSGIRSPLAETTTPVIPERTLVRLDALRLFALERQGFSLSPVVVHDEGRVPGFAVRPQATIEPETDSLVIAGDEQSPFDLGRLANSYPAMVQTPRLVAGLFSDTGETARFLVLNRRSPLPTVLNLLALSVFLLGCWTLVRLTRWPMFNALFALAALRFAVWTIPAVHTGVLRGALIVAFDSTVLPFASALILGGFGVGLFAVLVFLPSMDEWKREVLHG